MAEREKVIRGLEACVSNQYLMQCTSCPYHTDKARCVTTLMRDALALLKEQEARVMTLEEIRSGAVEVAWLEDADKPNVIPGIWFRLSNEGGDEAVDIHVMDGFVGARLAVYGKKWRAWTSRPSEQQMRDTPWEDSDASR